MSSEPRKPLAMLVDDVANFRDALSAILEQEGCRIVAFADARLALSALSERATEAPDVLFLDLRMPGINGYQFLESLRENPAYTSLPVIILSFAVDPTEIERALSLGGTEHLDKSEVSRTRLRDILARHVAMPQSTTQG